MDKEALKNIFASAICSGTFMVLNLNGRDSRIYPCHYPPFLPSSKIILGDF